MAAVLGVLCLVSGLVWLTVAPARPAPVPDFGAPPDPDRAAVVAAPVAAPGSRAPAEDPAAAVPTADPAGPVAVELPAGGVRAPIVPVGVQPDGLLAVPDPPDSVGWWRYGAAPGAGSGTVVLAGHVDSTAAGLGPFAALRHAAPGDAVVLTDADGGTRQYRVQARRSYLKRDLPAEVFDRAGPARLIMITCGSPFDRERRSYAENVVVYAPPIDR